MRGLGTLKNAPDPIGPGTAAWNAFELYVIALQEEAPRKARVEMARAYLRRCLRAAGRGDLQNAWCDRAKEWEES